MGNCSFGLSHHVARRVGCGSQIDGSTLLSCQPDRVRRGAQISSWQKEWYVPIVRHVCNGPGVRSRSLDQHRCWWCVCVDLHTVGAEFDPKPQSLWWKQCAIAVTGSTDLSVLSACCQRFVLGGTNRFLAEPVLAETGTYAFLMCRSRQVWQSRIVGRASGGCHRLQSEQGLCDRITKDLYRIWYVGRSFATNVVFYLAVLSTYGNAASLAERTGDAIVCGARACAITSQNTTI